MNERLIQFIWQFQYFNKQQLLTSQGETLLVEKPGTWNHHQGPDFSEAIVRIGTTKWVGNIEIHLCSSDWYKHRHQGDRHYANIILHVVWTDDAPVKDPHGNFFPTLVLAPLIPKWLLDRYRQMMETLITVPCQSFLPVLDHLGWCAWKERLAAERLERKSAHIISLVRQSGGHWEEVCWWMLASNFGIKINAVLFEQVAKSIPLTILYKHRNQVQQLEALLLGQANLLAAKMEDGYALLLQREYRFLKKKYQLSNVNAQPAFLRMRPAAFPTVRLAQLAMFMHLSGTVFAQILSTKESGELEAMFCVTANDYWHYRYRFNEPAAFHPKQLGKQMAQNILINTVIPILFAYGTYTREQAQKEKAIRWLYGLPHEQNQITGQWQRSGIAHRNALDSQALIELTNHYCLHKRCLDCAVGNRILRNNVL